MRTLALLGRPLICAAVLACPVFAQGDSVGGSDTVTFFYTIELIDTMPGESHLSVSGDTVAFVLYFIDTHCSRSVCTFERRGRSLCIRRRPAPERANCRPGTDYLYRLEGWVRNIPPGRYWFELISHCAGKPENLLKEAVAVGNSP